MEKICLEQDPHLQRVCGRRLQRLELRARIYAGAETARGRLAAIR